jgi:uncharacterized membrane protein YbhN (UPF0104 family)
MDRQRQGWRRVLAALRWLLRPRVVLPVVVAVALVAVLLALNDARVALHHVLEFPPGLLALYVAFMLAYEAVRTGQWLLWLRVLGVRAPLRVRAFAFLAGEGGQLLPAGNYLRTYLLRQAAGTPYGSAVVATTATMWLEDVIALVAVIVLGIPGWHWLRPTATGLLVAISIAAAVIVWLLRIAHRSAHLSRWIAALLKRYPRLRVGVEEGGQLREAAGLLARPRVLLAQAAFGAAYLALGAGAFCVILQGLGLTQLTLAERLGVYAFSLAVGLFAPLPLDLGVIEASGVGALVACGVDPGVAVAAMLLQRALSSGVAMLVAGGATLVCGGERRAALAGASATRRMPLDGQIEAHPEREPAGERAP